MSRDDRRQNGRVASNQVHREKKKLRDKNTDLEQRLREKTRTITHLERNILTLKDEAAQQIDTIRMEAQESDQLKDQLLNIGTKAIQDVCIKSEAVQAEKEAIATLLEAREKNLVELQDAWLGDAPEQTRAAVEAFSERSLGLVRGLQADVSREEAEKQKLLMENKKLQAKHAVVEDLRRQNAALQVKSERDNATLQELRRGREEDKRSVRMAEGAKRAADSRANEAKEIAEQQELIINRLLSENERHLRDFPQAGRC